MKVYYIYCKFSIFLSRGKCDIQYVEESVWNCVEKLPENQSWIIPEIQLSIFLHIHIFDWNVRYIEREAQFGSLNMLILNAMFQHLEERKKRRTPRWKLIRKCPVFYISSYFTITISQIWSMLYNSMESESNLVYCVLPIISRAHGSGNG
jgi:hypothetical protein